MSNILSKPLGEMIESRSMNPSSFLIADFFTARQLAVSS
jgi:hypothetical protein